MIVAGPLIQVDWGMKYVLNAVNNNRSRRMFNHVHNSFDSEQIISSHSCYHFKPSAEPCPRNWRLSNYAVGFNLISMPTAYIVMSAVVIMFGVMGVRMFDIRLGVEPVLDVSRLAFWAI